MMVKKGVSSKSEKQFPFAEKYDDLGKCPKCGKSFSKKTAKESGNKCPYCKEVV